MKKLSLILAAFGMAAVFTACGDDSSSSPSDNGGQGKPSTGKVVSCTTMGGMMCVELPAGFISADDCAEMGAPGAEAVFGSGCPSGAKLTCNDEAVTSYMYGEFFDGLTCDDIEDDEE